MTDKVERQAMQHNGDTGMARRNYPVRIIGLMAGFLCVAGAFYEQGAAVLTWLLTAVYSFGWPHLATAIALRSNNPRQTELNNLLVDTAAGGLWIVLIAGNLAPSAVIATHLCLGNMASGGPKLFLRGMAVLVLSALSVSLVIGFEPHIHSSTLAILSALPLLFLYPLMTGYITHELGRRMAVQRAEFRELSQRDRLTGLYNRGHWDHLLTAEFMRLRRLGGQAAVVMLDIDHFKAFNDRWGHPGGDEVLRLVADSLRAESRTEDMVARFGGEEFCILLPGADNADGKVFAERARQRIARNESPAAVTVSIGVAAFTDDLADADQWLQRADQALYDAKQAGRDCTRTPASIHTAVS